MILAEKHHWNDLVQRFDPQEPLWSASRLADVFKVAHVKNFILFMSMSQKIVALPWVVADMPLCCMLLS